MADILPPGVAGSSQGADQGHIGVGGSDHWQKSVRIPSPAAVAQGRASLGRGGDAPWSGSIRDLESAFVAVGGPGEVRDKRTVAICGQDLKAPLLRARLCHRMRQRNSPDLVAGLV